MVRTQIQLTEEQHRELKRWARERGISLSAAVRRCVGDCLSNEDAAGGRQDRIREALTVVGKYADEGGLSRVAIEHDKALAEAFTR